MKDQRDIQPEHILHGIDLSKSYILDWKKNHQEFEITLELCIWPESTYYTKPLKNELTCYKKGRLIFYGIKELHGFVELKSVQPNRDLDGSLDWDCIYNFKTTPGCFKFNTEFARIEIYCKGYYIEIKE